MLEVLTHTDSCGGVVLQPVAVAHLGIEHLTGGEDLVTLDKVEQRDGFNREKIHSIISRFYFPQNNGAMSIEQKTRKISQDSFFDTLLMTLRYLAEKGLKKFDLTPPLLFCVH